MNPSALIISIPSIDDGVLSSNCSEAAYENDDQVSCTGSLTSSSRSISGSSPTITTRSMSSFGDSSRKVINSSVSSDLELINLACAAMGQRPIEIQALSLSTNTRKNRRPLKSLKALSELANLTQLDLSGNAVERLDGIQLLSQLQILAIPRNHLKTLSASLFNLNRLTNLDLSGNFIAHLPRAFSGLTLLKVLNLSGNNLNTLREVDALAPLSNLLSCSLAANPFCRLPTYKDYAICKIRSLERLDEVEISQAGRDRAAKRFSSAMFSKDLCLREAEQVHEDKQNRLLETQSALEAENLRLKGELQVKSKLLQNKSRAWSSATEQLLQLQQEVAMLNLDRSREVLPFDDDICDAGQITMAIATSRKINSLSQQRPRSALRAPSPKRLLKKRCDSLSEHDLHSHSLQNDDRDDNKTSGMSQNKMFVDASCSPLRTIPPSTFTNSSNESYIDVGGADKKEDEKEHQRADKVTSPFVRMEHKRLVQLMSSASNAAISQKLCKRANGVDLVRDTLRKLDTDIMDKVSALVLEEEEPLSIDDVSFGRTASIPTFEDDLACPAYSTLR